MLAKVLGRPLFHRGIGLRIENEMCLTDERHELHRPSGPSHGLRKLEAMKQKLACPSGFTRHGKESTREANDERRPVTGQIEIREPATSNACALAPRFSSADRISAPSISASG